MIKSYKVIKYIYQGKLQHLNVRMKQNELAVNIQQARDHIRRLKKQAQQIQTTIKNPLSSSQDQSFNLNQYVNNALYSLAKNDNELDTKVQQYKSSKLPSIYQKADKVEEAFYLNGYKKYRKEPIKKSLTKSKVNSFSTRADDSFSFAVENRKVKIHSFSEKHKPVQINSQSRLGSMLQHDSVVIPDNISFQKLGSAHSSIRNRKYEQKVRLVNFNEVSFIQQNTSEKSLTKKDSALGYDSVVDSFSNHFFMIIKGRTARQSPEFSSYQRIYKSIFPKIQQQIRQLQKLTKHYEVGFARFDGKKLAYLCLKQNIKKTELIDCLIQGREEILMKLPQTKYKGKEGKIRAANKIIAFWRMKVTRAKYLQLKQKTIILQDFFRRKRLMLQLQRKITERNTKVMQKFEQRQQYFQSNYKFLKQQKRIQIHINSIQTDEQKRLTMQNFSQRQNIQLSRIFSLKDQNLILIYISAKQLPQQVINYYYKILQLSNVKSFKDRLFFLSPREVKFPEHFSTTKLLYYCSHTLKQLKSITEGMPSILVAGHPCNQLIKICDFVDCYLFGGQPSKMKMFMSKSQTKRLLKNLCIETLPGSMEMYDYGEFLNTFSVLIVKNPQVLTWVLKIDDEFQGRGLAYIQLGKSKIVTSLLKKIEYQSNSQFFATDLVSEPANQQITIKIRDYLKQKLSSKLMIATPLLYRTYEEFMGRFIKKGGIIEAHPPCSRQYLTYPCISFIVDPDYSFQVVCTYQKLPSTPFKSIASCFPQKSLEHHQIQSLCRQLTESFKIRKLFGYFTVDLVFYKKEDQTKYWVTGIEPYLNNITSGYRIFDALMEGKYVQEKNIYLAEVYEQVPNNDEKLSMKTISTAQRRMKQKKPVHSEQSQVQLASREFIFIPHFLNKAFSTINIKQFFKQARIQQFNFDIANKAGTCMLLFDQLTSGEMGLMAVGQKREDNVEKLKKVLEFIARVTQLRNQDYGKSDLEPSTDKVSITEVMSKFLTMERKEKRKDAKKKALEQFKNKMDLQLI